MSVDCDIFNKVLYVVEWILNNFLTISSSLRGLKFSILTGGKSEEPHSANDYGNKFNFYKLILHTTTANNNNNK